MAGTEEESELRDLSKRLDKAREREAAKNLKPGTDGRDMGQAMRMAIEFVVAVIVGGAIGWYLDGWLGTKPWLMIVFFFLGVGAGFTNVYRVANAIAAENKVANDQPDQEAGGD